MPTIHAADKTYIPNVRRIAWDTGEMCEFASAFVSALGSLGEDISYALVMGACGAAFRFTLDPGRWNFGNYGIRNFSPDPDEPLRRAFRSTGYACQICPRGDEAVDAARILDSLDRGVPVLAFGVVGPSDCCILAGYDQHGQVLLGWSTYQDIPDDHDIPHDSTGYFRKPGWHANLGGYILIGEKTAPPALRQVYLDALEWGVALLGQASLGQNISGLAGLRAWAAEMTQAEYFPAGDENTLGQRYVSTAINMTMLRDHTWAEPFLCQAAIAIPDCRDELEQATQLYAEMSRTRCQAEAVIDDLFSPGAMAAIADPLARAQYAALILQIAEQEEAAAERIAAAVHSASRKE